MVAGPVPDTRERSMMLDKNPLHPVCTLEPDLTWKVWRGVRFDVRPVTFEGTAEEVADKVQALRDKAPLPVGLNHCAVYWLKVRPFEKDRIGVTLTLYVEREDHQEPPRQPIRENLLEAIRVELESLTPVENNLDEPGVTQ